MPSAPRPQGQKASKQLAAIDQLLIAAIMQGRAKKCEAIKKIVQLVPGWTRADCWKRIQRLRKKNPELAAFDELSPRRAQCAGEKNPVRRPPLLPWTSADDNKLFTWAGYEPVKRIAQRLGRSEQAVRFRLGSLGISAKVTDGWSLWGLRKLLRVSPGRLRYLIGSGMLRVRDPRISANSLASLCDEIHESLEFSAMERIAAALANGDGAFPWERAANLLGVPVAQIQAWVSAGKLRLMDTFVTDRSFEEFCKKHGEELKACLIDAATAKWLVTEYGMSESVLNGGTVSRARKHALVVRTCKCGRKIVGNPYFRHVKFCQVANASDLRDAS
jgi:hypothetical protein